MPFMESESMTIKRIEVALRKMDLQLLRDGAYKLHEKLHAGHKFEFINDLRHILDYIDSTDIPHEVNDILRNTIIEILKKNDEDTSWQEAGVQEMEFENLDKLDELIANIDKLPEAKVEPEPVELEPFKDYEGPPEPQMQPVQQALPVAREEHYHAPFQQAKEKSGDGFQDIGKADEIAVFYDDANTNIDFSQIKDYRNQLNILFAKDKLKNHGDFDLLGQIADIINAVNTQIDDVDKILSTLTTTKNVVHCLTTSQSQNVSNAFVSSHLDFEIPFVKKAKNPNAYALIPMLGFSNIFVCSGCNSRTLKTGLNVKALSIQCPECGGASFPDLYAVNSYNPDCNPVFWHRAFSALVRSRVWVLVNPPLDVNKEIIVDFLKSACVTSSPKRIYVISQDVEKREFYKQMLGSQVPNCDIRADYPSQEKLCEDFISTEIMMKVSLGE